MKRQNSMQQVKNGTNETGKLSPRFTEILLDSGVRVWVTPLNRYQLKALQENADTNYPFPDKSQYEETISDDIAIGGRVVPAEQNPEYKKEYNRIAALRTEYFISRMRDLCIVYPDYPGGISELVEVFRDYVAMQRSLFGDKVPADEREATWKFAILRSPEDETQIDLVARDQLPVTEVEISDAMRLFRPAISWQKLRSMDVLNRLAPRTRDALQNRASTPVQRDVSDAGVGDNPAAVVSDKQTG